jgi:hypothetical protein
MIKTSKINQGLPFKKINIDILTLLGTDVNKSFTNFHYTYWSSFLHEVPQN